MLIYIAEIFLQKGGSAGIPSSYWTTKKDAVNTIKKTQLTKAATGVS